MIQVRARKALYPKCRPFLGHTVQVVVRALALVWGCGATHIGGDHCADLENGTSDLFIKKMRSVLSAEPMLHHNMSVDTATSWNLKAGAQTAEASGVFS